MSLITNRIRGWNELDALQGAVAATGLFVTLLAVYQKVRGGLFAESYPVYGVLILLAIGIHTVISSSQKKDSFRMGMSDDVSVALGQTLFVSFILLVYLAATKDQTISRIFLFAYLALLMVVLLVVRKLSSRFLGPIIFHNVHRCGAIVIGGAEKAEQAAAWVESKSSLGMEALGWLSDDPSGAESHRLPRLGSLRELEKVIQSSGATVVLVTDFLNARIRLPWLRAVCDRCGVRLAFTIDFGDALPCSISCYQEGDVSVITLRDEPLESPFNRVLKRFLDIACALPVVILILPPLALFVRLMHWIYSPGPLLFNQERIGLRGQSFTIYKFRTMDVQDSDPAIQAQADDWRIFTAGRWLRRLSLDEFPQFLNVLQGTMSIVGPRPHMGLHDINFAKVASLYRFRSLIKPGITGLAQVLGYRGPTNTAADVQSRTRSDLYYMENWSLKLDLIIIARTFLQFLRQRGAV